MPVSCRGRRALGVSAPFLHHERDRLLVLVESTFIFSSNVCSFVQQEGHHGVIPPQRSCTDWRRSIYKTHSRSDWVCVYLHVLLSIPKCSKRSKANLFLGCQCVLHSQEETRPTASDETKWKVDEVNGSSNRDCSEFAIDTFPKQTLFVGNYAPTIAREPFAAASANSTCDRMTPSRACWSS